MKSQYIVIFFGYVVYDRKYKNNGLINTFVLTVRHFYITLALSTILLIRPHCIFNQYGLFRAIHYVSIDKTVGLVAAEFGALGGIGYGDDVAFRFTFTEVGI